MEQHIIPFNQGIHLTPSAAEDGQLGDCINLIPKDGSLRNVPQLEPVMSKTQPSSQIEIADGYTLAYVHRPNVDTDKYIVSKKTTTQGHTETSLWLNPVESGDTAILTLNTDETIKQITSVGNTLIVLASDGMHYLLWKQDAYVSLGSHIPETLVHFDLTNAGTATVNEKTDIDPDFEPTTFTHTENEDHNIAYNTIGFEEGYQTPFNNAIYGVLNKMMKEEVDDKGCFASPFFVRYAYRLYDGSLVMHSAPIYIDDLFALSVATEQEDGFLVTGDPKYNYWGNAQHDLDIHIVKYLDSDHTGDGSDNDPEIDLNCFWNFAINRFRLNYKVEEEIPAEWSDIIKSIDIFISQPFYIYDQNGKIETVRHEIHEDGDNHYQQVIVDVPKVEHQDDLINNCGNFYLIKSIPLNEIDTSPHEIDTSGYLGSLTTMERMTDDYDSHDTLIPLYSFPYNQRLNIANITKGIFGGFNANAFSLRQGLDKLTMAVTIHTPEKDVSYRLAEIENVAIPTELHYYIPSQFPVTLQIVVSKGDVGTQTVELTSHKFLNGYYAVVLKSAFANPESKTYEQLVADLPTTSADTTITLPNKIYTSEINNPFFFPVSGINTVGVGEIKGICAAVKALSTGQFGQFPLYVFTTDGIWALEVSAEGKYSTKQPVTRDVCSNPNSIVQTDSAVLYATERGLHILQGSETKILTRALEAYTDTFDASGITIPTEWSSITANVLSATPLLTELANAQISYDGINHIVHVYPSSGYSHHILHLDSMEWTRTTQPIPSTFIDGYPNATLQIGQKLYQYALPSYDNSILHQGFLLTRETALGSPTTHKILKDMRTLKHWYSAASSNHKVRIIPLISNDRLHWYRLTSLHAHSAIWYRFAIFTLMADSDMLEALTLITEDRRTNKLR